MDGSLGGVLNLEQVVLANGSAINGGGVFNDEGVVRLMAGAVISGNYASGAGGGIYSWNGILEKSTEGLAFISNNEAASFGGGIYAIRNSSLSADVGRNILRLDGVVFQGNRVSGASGQGGGIYTNADQMELNNVVFYENQAGGAGSSGGAIYVAGGGGSAATIGNSEFISNSAHDGGGVYDGRGDAGLDTGSRFNERGNAGLEITNSWFYRNFAENDGGAIYNGEEINISVSLFEENEAAREGGGIKNWPSGILDIANSTFSKNIAPEAPAIFNFGQAYISYTTIADSVGEGALFSWYATMEVANLIVANNQGGDCHFRHAIRLNGINLDSDGTCAGFDVSADPLLGPLQDNGGPTHTHALLAGSPAIDAATSACPDTDQRGELRPLGSACDLGAYESFSAAAISPDVIPNPNILIVERDFPCYTGPGPQYNTLSTLKAGIELEIAGYGFDGGWLVANHPTLQERHCWIDEDFVSFTIPVDQLRLIAIPAEPTATLSPTKGPREPSEPTATLCVPPLIEPKACD